MGSMEIEIVREHCKGKKAHHTKTSRNKHKPHGCTPAKHPAGKKHAVATRGRGPAGGGLHGAPGHP